MIVCPNCSHHNPDGAVQCEACYTPLPAVMACPSCNALVQTDASFCGQCGYDLRQFAEAGSAPPAPPSLSVNSMGEPASGADIPDLTPPEPLIEPDPIPIATTGSNGLESPPPDPSELLSSAIPLKASVFAEEASASSPPPSTHSGYPDVGGDSTQLQVAEVRLLHVQTNTVIELQQNLPLIRIGKPNDRVPPHIDVSGFPDSEIVSRVHANIRVEGDIYYIEDVGSSNGTYINNMPLAYGNRHRLRVGDRIALGKGDKVTFIFQSSEF
ncbi:MAG: FHA domain-containing protein [Leptolyngbyaceae cyanobacterium MO_188.B28]|nr:FHA domain-containing protein [Leptolyngbyaceae cyanobacterium MO_188.B28]